MESVKRGESSWLAGVTRKDEVVARIRDEGALMARDFDSLNEHANHLIGSSLTAHGFTTLGQVNVCNTFSISNTALRATCRRQSASLATSVCRFCMATRSSAGSIARLIETSATSNYSIFTSKLKSLTGRDLLSNSERRSLASRCLIVVIPVRLSAPISPNGSLCYSVYRSKL